MSAYDVEPGTSAGLAAIPRKPVSTPETEAEPVLRRTDDFSLFLGGPVYQFLVRIGLISPELNRLGVRMFAISMLAWAPLAVLTILGGRFLGGARIPFLYGIEVHVKLLIALPLLILAEVFVHSRMREILRQFIDRQIITREQLPKFNAILESAARWRNSAPAELAIIAAVLLIGTFWWRDLMAIHADSWYAVHPAGGLKLTAAGYWYQFVSIPIVQFFFLRWWYRIFIWFRLLRQVSRLDLNLVPSHPDKACGLGFLGEIVFALAPFLLAISATFSGNFASRILYDGAELKGLTIEIVALVIFVFLLALGPLCVFTGLLRRERRLGICTYGPLASEYVLEFERKWIKGTRPADQTLLGSSDIQSLADMSHSFDVVASIRPFPFDKESIIALAFIVAIPLLPLLLSTFSIQELAERLVSVLL